VPSFYFHFGLKIKYKKAKTTSKIMHLLFVAVALWTATAPLAHAALVTGYARAFESSLLFKFEPIQCVTFIFLFDDVVNTTNKKSFGSSRHHAPRRDRCQRPVFV